MADHPDCRSCAFFRQTGFSGQGNVAMSCCRHAPKVFQPRPGHSPVTAWPTVRPDDFCGDHREKGRAGLPISGEVKATRMDVLDVIACRNEYGHGNRILCGWLWALLGRSLPDDEIAEYARGLASQPGYGPEDEEAATESLVEFRSAMTAA